MPKKKYIVDLTDSERTELEQLTKKGKIAAYKMNHARILLLADVNPQEGGWTDSKISEALNVAQATIERVRKRFVESGIESSLTRKKQEHRRAKIIDGEKEAYREHPNYVMSINAQKGKKAFVITILVPITQFREPLKIYELPKRLAI